MKVILRRHGPTLWNEQRRYMGRTDLPLSEEGTKLVEMQSSDPEVQVVHTSCLQRTVQTAKILYPGAEIIQHKGLNEIDFGKFEGKSAEEMEDWEEYTSWVDSYCEGAIPDGEDKTGFTQRCVETFKEIIAANKGKPAVWFVVHGGTIRSVLSSCGMPLKPYFEWGAENCGGYTAKALWEPDLVLSQIEKIPTIGY